MKIVDKVKSNQKLMRFIETTQNRITDSEMGTTSVVVAYYLLLSLFPLMIALGNLLPYLSIDPNTVLSYVQELIRIKSMILSDQRSKISSPLALAGCYRSPPWLRCGRRVKVSMPCKLR